ncbi:GNAT family N-acetyltransferase [Coraliomargarita sinensis]|uniref:GNAT family N-acetyltransferase n=1 Tax=Coraliomargarita sinensis TaxID=2174842 RepID=A0A317ZEC3_9BACT|nr:GNAT family N-acetyltransferase [Coraliomargarita sinensis]PXA03062.1 GNAT family N-acetyltransferase [Coraliomargarita sinensis]
MKIETASLAYLESFWKAVDSVARERKFLHFVKAPEIESTHTFLKEIQENEWTQVFAIEAGEVVGWCDIIPYPYEGSKHVARMGMGVVANHRRKGIGEKLLSKAIADAQSKGIKRIEMEVFSTNTPAIELYKKLGFQVEGRKLKARELDGIECDFIIMALHSDQVEPADREYGVLRRT